MYLLVDIDDEVFAGCTSLESITIPESVQFLGTDAFRGCSNLKEIYLENTRLGSIGYGAFGGCPATIYVSGPKADFVESTLLGEYDGRKKVVRLD